MIFNILEISCKLQGDVIIKPSHPMKITHPMAPLKNLNYFKVAIDLGRLGRFPSIGPSSMGVLR
jgi:hypothetical protein